MYLETDLFDKDGLQFSRVKKNHYKLTFTMENKNIIISKIIDFSLIKLIYDLNEDVYETVNIEKINESEAIVTILMKHFFEDLGLPQRYSFIHMRKVVEEDKIIFYSQTIKNHRPEGMPENAEVIAIENMTSICHIITPHLINFSFIFNFNEIMNVPHFAEKMVSLIINKIFKRVKQFIENICI
jgi:hypothetical protein